jgi:hypothetical protein
VGSITIGAQSADSFQWAHRYPLFLVFVINWMSLSLAMMALRTRLGGPLATTGQVLTTTGDPSADSSLSGCDPQQGSTKS